MTTAWLGTKAVFISLFQMIEVLLHPLAERGRTGGRSLPAFKRSNSERIPKFGGGSLRACPKFAATVDVPKGADPEAFQNLDSGQARLQELGEP